MKLSPEQQGFVLELINEHANWITELAGHAQQDPNMDPALKQTDAAQAAEEQAKAEVLASGGGSPSGAGSEPMPPMDQPQITPPQGPEMPQPPPQH